MDMIVTDQIIADGFGFPLSSLDTLALFEQYEPLEKSGLPVEAPREDHCDNVYPSLG